MIKIKNPRLAAITRSDDAINAFSRASESGQARLALEVLVEIIPELIAKIDALEARLGVETTIEDVDAAPVEIVADEPSDPVPTKTARTKTPKEDATED